MELILEEGVPLDTVKVAFLVKVSQPNIQRMHIITFNLNLSNLNNRYLCLTHKMLSNEFKKKINKWGKLCDEEVLQFQLMSTFAPFILVITEEFSFSLLYETWFELSIFPWSM